MPLGDHQAVNRGMIPFHYNLQVSTSMKLYLDSKDLIAIFQNDDPCSVASFQEYLSGNGHELVVSSSTIIEISAPLAKPSSKTNVMALLNKLQQVPIR